MNILVCVKQVPDTTEIKIDPVKNTLIRDGVPSILNPFDAYALEAAARIKDEHPETKITCISMGPPQAESMLRECVGIAADQVYLVSGRKFGGSDTLATSYILSAGIRKVEETEGKFDMIFCGKQAIDGDTAQVGPEIGENFGLAQVTYALEASLVGDELQVKKETEEGVEVVGVKTPCLVTFTKPSFEPRTATIKRKMAAKRATINVLTEEAFPDMDWSRCGLTGSPTRVKGTFVPPVKTGGMRIQEETEAASAKKLLSVLTEKGIL